ncbi:hypothetical protein ANCCAN_30646 [Ancylostoma caninum]|uniref:Uncharacterized protein n=1 Tax=Ancylostoma caninum TaxID=29170 RepID=A0A368F0F2_ANCCA|nr:hypothetical protein ANCCAN_30646 [Ancylostoma caninum]
MFANFNPNPAKNPSEDRPPTDIGTRGCTLSEASACNSFEEAKIVPNPTKNPRTGSSSSTSLYTAVEASKTPSSACNNSTQSKVKSKSVSKKGVKHSKTPDPLKSRVRKGRRTKTKSKSKKGGHGKKAKKIVSTLSLSLRAISSWALWLTLIFQSNKNFWLRVRL